MQRHITIDIDGVEHLDEISVLADFHTIGKGQFEDLIGQRTVTLRDDPRRRGHISARRSFQRDGRAPRFRRV